MSVAGLKHMTTGSVAKRLTLSRHVANALSKLVPIIGFISCASLD